MWQWFKDIIFTRRSFLQALLPISFLHPAESKLLSIEAPVRPGQSDDAGPTANMLVMDVYTGAMPAAGVSNNQITAVMGKLSRTCSSFHGFFKPELIKRACRQLWQAVVDDDRQTVKRILDSKPELLLDKAQKGIAIQSQLSWLIIDAENEGALSIAAKRKQIKMIELLLPYYDKLEQTEGVIKAKAEGLAAWKAYEIQKNADGEDEIVIPRLYVGYAKSLIEVFKEETFPNGREGKLSEKTEDALKLLFNILLPKKAVRLDDYIDPELFLLVLYKVYFDHFHSFQHWCQRDVFCLRVIGLAQSVLPPETAKIFCQGFYSVVEGGKIGEWTESLKLLGGESFYRPTREALSGLGFEYICDREGRLRGGLGRNVVCLLGRRRDALAMGKLLQAKAMIFWNIAQPLLRLSDQLAGRKQASCVIL